MSIRFEAITKDNWLKCCMLEVNDNQKSFVASNAFSLAQSKFEPEMIPLGIYNSEEIIGFAMYVKDSEAEKAWIVRFMTDKRFQGQGYGREALGLLINRIKGEYPGSDIFLCVEPENTVAIKLYKSFGFAPTGEKWDNEDIYSKTT